MSISVHFQDITHTKKCSDSITDNYNFEEKSVVSTTLKNIIKDCEQNACWIKVLNIIK